MNIPRGKTVDALIAVSAVLWLILYAAGWDGYVAYFAGFIPARFEGSLDLIDALPMWLTPLTSAFLHANFMHLGFNMLMLLFCGRYVEHILGRVPFLALYVIGAFVSAFAQYWVDPASQIPMVGASGAISAVIGAYAVFYGKQRTRAIGPISARALQIAWLAAAWVVIQTLFGFAMANAHMPIAIGAHIGGFVAGLFLARPLMLWRFRNA